MTSTLSELNSYFFSIRTRPQPPSLTVASPRGSWHFDCQTFEQAFRCLQYIFHSKRAIAIHSLITPDCIQPYTPHPFARRAPCFLMFFLARIEKFFLRPVARENFFADRLTPKWGPYLPFDVFLQRYRGIFFETGGHTKDYLCRVK